MLIILLLLCEYWLPLVACGDVLSVEKRLKDKLFNSTYDRYFVPKSSPFNPVVVELEARIHQLVEVDEIKQRVNFHLWLTMNWYDIRLTWNSSDFGDIDYTYVSAQKIWTPDITLRNSINEGNGNPFLAYTDHEKEVVKLEESGKISLYKKVVTTSSCSMDFRAFPYDEHECVLNFFSWNYDNGSIYVKPKESTTFEEPNDLWNITKIETKEDKLIFNCCADPFTMSVVKVNLQRIYTPLTLGLVVPSALLSSLVLLSFLLPAEGGERISLVITILLTVTLFQQLTSEMIPRSQLPYLSQYFFVLLIALTLALIANTLVLNLHFRTETEMPVLVQKMLRFCRKAKNPVQEIPENQRFLPLELRKSSSSLKMENLDNPSSKVNVNIGNGNAIGLAAENEPASDWLEVCCILDRIFFVLFTLIFIAALVWVSLMK